MAPAKYDVIVIGGSFSGLSAALQLARSLRTVAVLDDETQLKKRIWASHGFLGSDGVSPADFIGRAKQQLSGYSNIHSIRESATGIRGQQDNFIVALSDRQSIEARRIIMASGISFSLPQLPGLADLWGKSVFSCPYCHAYEHKGSPLAILRLDQTPLYEALMYPDWGPVTLLMNGAQLSEQHARLISKRGISVQTRLIERFESPCRAVYTDGSYEDFSVLFVSPPYAPAPLAERTRLAILTNPKGRLLKVDPTGQTSVEGIYSCGTSSLGNGTIPEAVGDGAKVGKAVHASFHFRTSVKTT